MNKNDVVKYELLETNWGRELCYDYDFVLISQDEYPPSEYS